LPHPVHEAVGRTNSQSLIMPFAGVLKMTHYYHSAGQTSDIIFINLKSNLSKSILL